MTEAELVLWSVLKNRKFYGLKFRRQFSIGYYNMDFYCPAERLAIEVDGPYHNNHEMKMKDFERDKHLSEMNIKVLRFENLTQVLKQVKSHLNPHTH